MEVAHEADAFDLFGLEQDNEIDFETAYKMISKFDEEISTLNEEEVPSKLHCESHENNKEPITPAPMEHSNGQFKEDQAKYEASGVLSNWYFQTPNHNNEPIRDKRFIAQPTPPLHQLNDSQALARVELLSTYESNAIEQFLDSLISHSGANVTSTSAIAMNDRSKTINLADLEMSSGIGEEPGQKGYDTTQRDAKVTHIKSDTNYQIAKTSDSMSLDVYFPPVVSIPEFSIADSDIPKEIKNDPASIRKWKHVEIERLRRTNVKKVFDELIGMAKYPRVGDSRITKSSTEKRVPKHTLLNFIFEDLQSILLANNELEKMVNEAGSPKVARRNETGQVPP